VCCIEPDVDGDYVFERGTAACFVRIDDTSGLLTAWPVAPPPGVKQPLRLPRRGKQDTRTRASRPIPRVRRALDFGPWLFGTTTALFDGEHQAGRFHLA
jgi:hypothetical protein